MDAEYGIRTIEELFGSNAFGIVNPLLHRMEYDVVLFRGHYGKGGVSHIPIHIPGYFSGKLIGYESDPEVGHTEVHITVNNIEPFGDHVDALEFGGRHPFVPCFY